MSDIAIESSDPTAVHHGTILKGRQAERELKITAAAFAGLREEAINKIVNSGPGDENRALVERLIVFVQTLAAVEKALKYAVVQGDAAKTYAQALAEADLLRQ